MAEALNSLYKHELIYRQPWNTAAEVEYATAEWVSWYNHQRLHGELGHVPPAEYETTNWAGDTAGTLAPETALQNN